MHPTPPTTIPAGCSHPLSSHPYGIGTTMDPFSLLWSIPVLFVFLAALVDGRSSTAQRTIADGGLDDDDASHPSVFELGNDDDIFENFDPYHELAQMDDDDLEDLVAINSVFDQLRRQCKIKYRHHRKCWQEHRDMLIETDQFANRFRMPPEHWDYLLEGIRDAITVDYEKSRESTGGNDPIYPEIIMAMGLRFLGLGSTPADLADLYGMSMTSCRRCLNMFLNAIDYNTELPELQVRLPDPTNDTALRDLADRWENVSTVFRLFENNLGCLDGWLPRTQAPSVPNQADYFSGHYQCYGLNVQAMCDPDLLFLYVAVAAPGKTNDARAFYRCNDLIQWLEALPEEYYSIGDNAYPLSLRMLIPFNKAEIVAFGKYADCARTYNFYLSQLRMRIEMAFGRLTTKWRILRRTLDFKCENNAKLVRVCIKLHNFCINMSILIHLAVTRSTARW